MTNEEISKILAEMAVLYEMESVEFKPRAYERASDGVAGLQEEVESVYKKDGIKGLMKIPGVGRGIAEHLKQLFSDGHFKEYDRLKKKFPVDIASLSSIEGVGPKMIKLLYNQLKIKNISDLEKAAASGELRAIPHIREKMEQKILKGIEYKKSGGGRVEIGKLLPLARAMKSRLEKVKGVEAIEIAGSLRRRQETIGDLDFLAVSENPEMICEFFSKMPEVSHVFAKGPTKVLVRLKQGLDADLRVLPKVSFGAALQYFTGSKDHNVEVRKIAIKKGYKLNEYGLFKSADTRGKKRRTTQKETLVAAHTEEEVYKKLGMDTPPPEMRLNRGEIEAALKHRLPKLVGYGDLKGDLQTQTDWTDGANSISEMAEEAMRLGHEYMAVTDHTRSLAMTGGADEKKLLRQMSEIDKLNLKFNPRSGGQKSKFKILKGAEVNILKDGSLDIDDKTLAKLDVVGAAVHSFFNLSREDQTARIIKAMGNRNVDIIFHPTGRIINRRKPYDVDIEAIIKAAKRTGTILEIDGHPWRLDLSDEHIRMAKEAGVKMVIDTDAHSVHELSYLEYGIAQARRGWAEKSDIINTLPLGDFLKCLKK
ncbi:DNA polymerase/3'-5' exonuclease PolX [Candidatus Giovannonibacteria bacterium]|nr:DNA polymerase/3'-5' exonuclease PolX [Candidatus Giovannonibacteria bacterium]